MSKKKKTKTTKTHPSSWKGFGLLGTLIAAALTLYQLQTSDATPETATVGQGVTSPYVDKAPEKAPASDRPAASAPTSTAPATTFSLRLEIPNDLRTREEIRLKRTGYTASYNPTYRTPHWVGWELTRDETKGDEERTNKFVPDPDVPEPRAEHADYTNTGYDRGHMAPAADMKWSEKAMAESFYMSNICPQDQKLNRDDWGDLEDLCRAWAKKYGRVYITCGPIYDSKRPKRIGKHRVAVPNRFFKVVLIYNRKNPVAMGFLFDNKAHHQDLRHYMVPVDSIESITGYDFFAKVPDDVEQRIEAVVPALPAR